jgi:hypothetical protein
VKDSCLGGPLNRCAVGYRGLACSECEVRYYRENKACLRCPTFHWFTLGILAVLAMGMVYMFMVVSPYVKGLASVRILYNFLQTSYRLRFLQVTWPFVVSSFLDFISTITPNLDFLRPECQIPISYEVKFWFLQMLPLLLILAIYGVYRMEKSARDYTLARHRAYITHSDMPVRPYNWWNGRCGQIMIFPVKMIARWGWWLFMWCILATLTMVWILLKKCKRRWCPTPIGMSSKDEDAELDDDDWGPANPDGTVATTTASTPGAPTAASGANDWCSCACAWPRRLERSCLVRCRMGWRVWCCPCRPLPSNAAAVAGYGVLGDGPDSIDDSTSGPGLMMRDMSQSDISQSHRDYSFEASRRDFASINEGALAGGRPWCQRMCQSLGCCGARRVHHFDEKTEASRITHRYRVPAFESHSGAQIQELLRVQRVTAVTASVVGDDSKGRSTDALGRSGIIRELQGEGKLGRTIELKNKMEMFHPSFKPALAHHEFMSVDDGDFQWRRSIKHQVVSMAKQQALEISERDAAINEWKQVEKAAEKEQLAAEDAVVNLLTMALQFAHLTLLQRSLEVLPCRRLLPELEVLRFHSEVECGSALHDRLRFAAFFFLIVWGAIMPAILIVLLLKQWNNNDLYSMRNRARYGFLILRYSERTWWWELVHLVRKGIMVLLVVFLSAEDQKYPQVCVSSSIVLIYPPSSLI